MHRHLKTDRALLLPHPSYRSLNSSHLSPSSPTQVSPIPSRELTNPGWLANLLCPGFRGNKTGRRCGPRLVSGARVSGYYSCRGKKGGLLGTRATLPVPDLPNYLPYFQLRGKGPIPWSSNKRALRGSEWDRRGFRATQRKRGIRWSTGLFGYLGILHRV
jgi:hypothetical protein